MIYKNIDRSEGQIWIEKENPHNLKYFVKGIEYTLSPTASYIYDSPKSESLSPGEIILPAGSVVKFNGKNNLEKASFPEDLEGVLGVTTSNLRKGELNQKLKVTVAQDGYVIIDHPELVFATEADYILGPSGNSYTETDIIGQPVYWFIGRIVSNKTDPPKYTYISSTGKEGKLTLATPSGFEKTNGDAVTDDSLNVGYDNLPQIGSVADISFSQGEKKIITSMKIHLNFSKFDSSLEWNWPRVHNSAISCGKISCDISQDTPKKVLPKAIEVRHGLFPDLASRKVKGYMPRCFIDITANPVEGDNINYSKEYSVSTDIQNYYNTLEDPKSVVLIKHPEPMFYRLSGRINYKFDKNHKPLI